MNSRSSQLRWQGSVLKTEAQSGYDRERCRDSRIDHDRETSCCNLDKSLRDWFVDDRNSGASFAINAAAGRQLLIDEFWPIFISWTEDKSAPAPDLYSESELISQLTLSQTQVERLREYVRRLSDPQVVRRKLLVETDADEETRRKCRHHYEALVGRVARAWPNYTEPAALWNIVETLSQVAWGSLSREPDWSFISHFDDADGFPVSSEFLADQTRLYEEWKEGTLLLVTAVTTGASVARARPELSPKISQIVDQRLTRFLLEANDIATRVLLGTHGREYFLERNLSFLEGAVSSATALLQGTPNS